MVVEDLFVFTPDTTSKAETQTLQWVQVAAVFQQIFDPFLIRPVADTRSTEQATTLKVQRTGDAVFVEGYVAGIRTRVYLANLPGTDHRCVEYFQAGR